jgi:formate-dependent nitrite reductase membrane component NrfD
MVKYTPQAEWIEKRGVLLWLAFFFIELGAGMFLVASFFGNLYSMVAGWLVCALLGGGLHLVFLGKPARFWRMVVSSGFKTSWISRGLMFVALFLVLGLIYIVTLLLASPASGVLVAAGVFAFFTVIYGGFAMNYVNGIPLWNTALLPVLYLISGLWGGAEVTLGIVLAGADASAALAIEEWIRILLAGFVILVPVYLVSVRYTSVTGQVSVRSIVVGKYRALFWIAVVVIGIIVPLAAVITSLSAGLESTPVGLLYLGIICGLAGDLAMRYLILRCGMYSPLVPSSAGEVIGARG